MLRSIGVRAAQSRYRASPNGMNADAAFSGGKPACAGDIGPLYRERVHPACPRRHPAFGRHYYAWHMSASSAPTEDARPGTPTPDDRYPAVRAPQIGTAEDGEKRSPNVVAHV